MLSSLHCEVLTLRLQVPLSVIGGRSQTILQQHNYSTLKQPTQTNPLNPSSSTFQQPSQTGILALLFQQPSQTKLVNLETTLSNPKLGLYCLGSTSATGLYINHLVVHQPLGSTSATGVYISHWFVHVHQPLIGASAIWLYISHLIVHQPCIEN